MTIPEPPSPHVAEDLPGLLLGELGQDDTRRISTHLRHCAGCRATLVDAAVAFGALAAAHRTLDGAADQSRGATAPESAQAPDPLPPLRASRLERARRLRPVRAGLAAAAALVLVVTAISISHQVGGGSTTHTDRLASATLQPLEAPPPAGGRVTLSRSGAQAVVGIRITGLPAPGRGQFYEAWLLDPATNKMMAMGVLPPAGRTTFTVAIDLLPGYTAVDISLQANDGDPHHSATSVLRATDL